MFIIWGGGGVLVLGSRDYIKEIGSLRVLHPCAQVHQMIFKDFRAPEVLWKELVVQWQPSNDDEGDGKNGDAKHPHPGWWWCADSWGFRVPISIPKNQWPWLRNPWRLEVLLPQSYFWPMSQASGLNFKESPQKIWPEIWYSTYILGSWNVHYPLVV